MTPLYLTNSLLSLSLFPLTPVFLSFDLPRSLSAFSPVSIFSDLFHLSPQSLSHPRRSHSLFRENFRNFGKFREISERSNDNHARGGLNIAPLKKRKFRRNFPHFFRYYSPWPEFIMAQTVGSSIIFVSQIYTTGKTFYVMHLF